METSRSLQQYRNALEAYRGYVYPLSSWTAKHAPPRGLTGKHCRPLQARVVDDIETFSSTIEAAMHDAGVPPEQADKDIARWEQTVFGSERFAFCGYPPPGLVALDVDTPEVIPQIEKELGLEFGQLDGLLSNTPAIINTKQRTLKAHSYLKVKPHHIPLLGRMMAMQVPGGHLGDLIAKPEPGQTGGKYQKLYGGHEHPDRATYRLVDASGRTLPHKAIHSAPELPVWLETALAAKYPSTPQPQPALQPATGTGASETLNHLFNLHTPVEKQMELVEQTLPEGCSIVPHWNGEIRIMSVKQTTQAAGAVVNIKPEDEGKSNIHFYSPTVKEAYLGTSEGSDTLRLSTIALLPQRQWATSDAHIGSMIRTLERELGIRKPNTVEAKVAKLLEQQPEPSDTLPMVYLKKLLHSQKMVSMLADHNLQFNTEKDNHYAPAENSSMAIRVLIATLAEHDCYIQNNTVRAKGEIYDGEDREIALAPILRSPTLKRVILDNWELFQTEGWNTLINSPTALKHGTQKFTSEMAAYGFYDIHTGQGSPETCLEDTATGSIYTPDKKTHQLTKIIGGEATHISKSKTNHAKFRYIQPGDHTALEQTVQDAKMVLAGIIRLAEQRGPLVYDADTATYSENPAYMGAYMPCPQSRAAVLLAFLSEALTGNSQTWLHLDGQDSTATGKSTFMEIARRVVPGTVKAKLAVAFGSNTDYDKQVLIGQRFVIDDEVRYVSGDMMDGLKELITNGVAARRIYGRTTYYTKPMSIITATNSSLQFHNADGVEGSIERRFVRLPCLPLADDGDVDQHYLERISDREWEAFITILAQPELFGLGHACSDLRRAAGGGNVTHEALAELKRLAISDNVISTPIDDWLQSAIVKGDASDFVIRGDIFRLMQLEPEVPVESNCVMNRGPGAKAMTRFDAHVKRLGGSGKQRKRITDRNGKQTQPWVNHGVQCIFEASYDEIIVSKQFKTDL